MPLASRPYRAYYTPLDRDGYPVASESGLLPFFDLKATDAEDATRKAFEIKRCPINNVVRLERGWPFPALTPAQRAKRAEFEAAMRADELRGLPTDFGALA